MARQEGEGEGVGRKGMIGREGMVREAGKERDRKGVSEKSKDGRD